MTYYYVQQDVISCCVCPRRHPLSPCLFSVCDLDMLLNACMHRLPVRAVLNCGDWASFPVQSWLSAKAVQRNRRKALLISSRVHFARPSARSISQWCCATATAQDASAKGAHTAWADRWFQPSKHAPDLLAVGSVMKPATSRYRLPPKEIMEIVDQPPEPSLSFSPDRKKVHRPVELVCKRISYMPLRACSPASGQPGSRHHASEAVNACRSCSCIDHPPYLRYLS